MQRAFPSQLGRRAVVGRMDPRFLEWVSAQCDFCGDDGDGSGAGARCASRRPGVGVVLARTERARCPRSQAGGPRRSPSQLAWSATPIRQRWTSTTVRGSVGASPSRSDHCNSTVRWKCSPGSISERTAAIPQAHPWLTPAHPQIIVILGLDPRIQAQSTASSFRQARPTGSAGATRRVPVNRSPLCGVSVRPSRLLKG